MSLYNQYPLASSKTCIRLLHYLAHDTFGVLVVDLDRDPPFRALSYVWGNGPTRKIIVENHTVLIRPNLYTFLTKLTLKDKYIWCDAICIDQSSDVERSHQVQLMRQIYSSAEATIVWLGEAEFPKGDKMKMYEMLAALTRRSYWTRVWIIQEIVVSNELIVQCGDETLPWNTLVDACTFPVNQNVRWAADLWAIPSDSDKDFIQRRALLGREIHYSMFSALARSRRRWPMRMDALQVLVERYEKSQCEDDRDNVIALLGIAREIGSPTEFKVDYSLNKENTFYGLLSWAENGAVDVRNRMRFAYAIARGLKLGSINKQSIRFTIRLQTWGVDVTTAVPTDLPISHIKTSLSESATILGSFDTGVLFTCQDTTLMGVGTYDIEQGWKAFAKIKPVATVGFDKVNMMKNNGRINLQLSDSAQLKMLIDHGFEKTFDVVPEKAAITQQRGGSGSLPEMPEDKVSIMKRLLRERTVLSNPTYIDVDSWWEQGVKHFNSVREDFEILRADAYPMARYHDLELPFSSLKRPAAAERWNQPNFASEALRQSHHRRKYRARQEGARGVRNLPNLRSQIGCLHQDEIV